MPSGFLPRNDIPLSVRLVQFRLKNSTDPDQIDFILETMKNLTPENPQDLEEPFIVKLVSFGPSKLDKYLFNSNLLLLLDLLYKCTLKIETGDNLGAEKILLESISLILSKLSANQNASSSKNQNQETNFKKLLVTLKEKRKLKRSNNPHTSSPLPAHPKRSR